MRSCSTKAVIFTKESSRWRLAKTRQIIFAQAELRGLFGQHLSWPRCLDLVVYLRVICLPASACYKPVTPKIHWSWTTYGWQSACRKLHWHHQAGVLELSQETSWLKLGSEGGNVQKHRVVLREQSSVSPETPLPVSSEKYKIQPNLS